MTVSKDVNIPINRVEGDLEVLVDIEDGVITEARSSGTMFRGFEELMLGRSALDALVITPRICGICSLTHLNAAVEALDMICGVAVPDNGRRLRHVTLMAEMIQNDIRQTVLMFMVDFAQKEAYQSAPFFREALNRYDPLKGWVAHEVIKETKKLLKIVAIIGGQWPHTSFMVPGGAAFMPDATRLMQCSMIVSQFRSWYERYILGCPIATWLQIKSLADLDNWLTESDKHRDSEVGFMLRCLRESGAGALGKGPNRFISYGNLSMPKDTAVKAASYRFTTAGYAKGTEVLPFDQSLIREDVSHAWFKRDDGPRHPFEGRTEPGPVVRNTDSYSWIKAPRYNGQAAETGALAETIVDGNPLFRDLVHNNGPNILARQLARLIRPATLLPAMSTWLDELIRRNSESFYKKVDIVPDGEGFGLIQAARGALGHWLGITDGRISQYQIITPTAWNGSPKDLGGTRGAWEQALLATAIKDAENPIEAGHIVRSFDPCLVCAVHTVRKK